MSEDKGRSNKVAAKAAFMKAGKPKTKTIKKDRQIRRTVEKNMTKQAEDRWLQRLIGK